MKAKKRSSQWKRLAALVMGVPVLLLSACATKAPPATPGASSGTAVQEPVSEPAKPVELKKLVIAEPVHLTGYLPLYVAQHEGYFEEQGLAVEVIQATGGAHVTAVVSGDAWGVIGGVDSMALGNKNSSDPIVSVVNVVNRANVYLFAAKGTAPASGSDEDLKAFMAGKRIVADHRRRCAGHLGRTIL